MATKHVCQECGCKCDSCVNNNSLHLHQEIESLKRQLLERDYHILQMETSVIKHAQQFPNGEWEHMRQELFMWKDKYERLYDSHKKLQKVNQGLEDKLLKLVDKFETEKNSLTKDIEDLTNQLVEARLSIDDLEEQNELYRSDCNIAIQLLQCKPSNFISHKLSSFPSDVQDKVKRHFTNHQRKELHCSNSSPELRTIKVPIPTFPPTAMVYSVNSVPTTTQSETYSSDISGAPDYVSAAIMAKVLEERSKERLSKQDRCHFCLFHRHRPSSKDKATQTRWSSVILQCMCSSSNIAHVHSRQRTESSSSSSGSHYHCGQSSPSSSTETAI